jgi:hypothetical protein
VLGRVEEARRLLELAIEVSGDEADEVKLMAVDDQDLAALCRAKAHSKEAESARPMCI